MLLKTQGHLFWEQTNGQRDLSVKINSLENENGHLRRLNILKSTAMRCYATLLMERISSLENKTE